ncbi:MAG: hypothetical protein Q4D38_11105 [Planctomycetia bacterium]|nr:hypothetical protein [Planctomycetia bacterium]
MKVPSKMRLGKLPIDFFAFRDRIILVLKFIGAQVHTRSPLKFPFCATLCEPWCVAPTADGTGNFNEKYYNTPSGVCAEGA